VLGLGLSLFLVRETLGHVNHESRVHGELPPDGVPTPREVFWRTTVLDRNLSSVTQAGLVNNLNDGMAWGLFPLFFAAAHMSLGQIAILAAIYPATQGLGQLGTGAWSDHVGRKPLIVAGMWIQALGIAAVIVSDRFAGFAVGATLLGIGTAFVYPTLLAAIGDVAHPSWRGSSVGVYRLWRDLGYAFGAVLAGLAADAFGLSAAMGLVAGLTFRRAWSWRFGWRRHTTPRSPLSWTFARRSRTRLAMSKARATSRWMCWRRGVPARGRRERPQGAMVAVAHLAETLSARRA
jgi:MFS family permease